MTMFPYDVVQPASVQGAPFEAARIIGRDIWLDMQAVTPLPTTAKGDLLLATGPEALRQRLLRRLTTAPEEWATNPEYGAGLIELLRDQLTPANVAAIKVRITGQAMRDTAVAKVRRVEVTAQENAAVIYLEVMPSSDDKPLAMTIAVPLS